MKLILSLAILLYTLPIAAQDLRDHLAVYATYSPTLVNGPSDDLNPNFRPWFQTAAFGFAIPISASPDVVVSLDFRGSVKPGTPGFETAFAAVKLAGPAIKRRYHFYGQLGVGYIAVRHITDGGTISTGSAITYVDTHPTQYSYPFALEALGGVEYTLSRHLTYRVAEAGIALGLQINLFDGGGSGTLVVPVSTGLVARF